MKRGQESNAPFSYQPALFGKSSKEAVPLEIESNEEERFGGEIESPERIRSSCIMAEKTPVNIYPLQESKRTLEDNFMLDSLNDQKNADLQVHSESKIQNPAAPTTRLLTPAEQERQIVSERSFMNALQNAIEHFGQKSESKSQVKRRVTNQKESPISAYNSSSATAANSVGEQRKEFTDLLSENELLKREYNALLAKYSELKGSNKNLMNDYAVLRSQLEEMKAVQIRH